MKGTRPVDAKVNSMLIFSGLRGVAGLQTACEHSGHGGSCSECNVWGLLLHSLCFDCRHPLLCDSPTTIS